MAPEYLCELVIQLDTLAGACVSTQVIYGDFTFSIAAPTLWNRLPTDIRNTSSFDFLKSVLKQTCLKLLSQINNYYRLNTL